MSLFAFVFIHQGHERKEINLCLAAFIDPLLQNRSTSILSKLPTTACWFRKNVGKDSKLAISNSRCASFVEANHSTVKSKDSLYFHTSSSPVEANNSKSANQ